MLLDCGCSTNLLGDITATQMNIKLSSASTVKLYNALGEEMSVIGQAEIPVEIPKLKRKETLTFFLVTKDLPDKEQVLIGIGALKQLELLPSRWPHSLDFASLEANQSKLPDKAYCKLSKEQVNLIKLNPAREKDIAEDMWHNMGTIEDIPRLKKLPEAVQKCIRRNQSIFSSTLRK
jgi:hypothetical protein